jgi:hypothetical protein
MAGELLGPDASSRTITLGLGQTAHGRVATVYTDAAATSLATIYTYDGTGTPGAAISGSQVTIDANSQLPQFWFPSAGVDTLYVRVNGKSGITTITADVDARLDVVAGITQGAAVADQGALTASAPAALTASAPSALTASAPSALTSAQLTGGESPTEGEHNQVQADLAALRTTVAALVTDITALRATVAAAVVDLPALRTPLAAAVTDLGTARTKTNALLGSLRTAGIIDT